VKQRNQITHLCQTLFKSLVLQLCHAYKNSNQSTLSTCQVNYGYRTPIGNTVHVVFIVNRYLQSLRWNIFQNLFQVEIESDDEIIDTLILQQYTIQTNYTLGLGMILTFARYPVIGFLRARYTVSCKSTGYPVSEHSAGLTGKILELF